MYECQQVHLRGLSTKALSLGSMLAPSSALLLVAVAAAAAKATPTGHSSPAALRLFAHPLCPRCHYMYNEWVSAGSFHMVHVDYLDRAVQVGSWRSTLRSAHSHMKRLPG